MNPFSIEQKRIELLNSLPKLFGRSRLFSIADFFIELFDTNNKLLIESYLHEFLEEFISELNIYSAFYLPPSSTERIIDLVSKINSVVINPETKNILNLVSDNLSHKVEDLNRALERNKNLLLPRITFPLIETNTYTENNINLGVLESVQIRINRAKTADSFLVIPSLQKEEEYLANQIKTSFYFAINYIHDHYKRINRFHEVIILFENRLASYEGNSLGIALTVGFIEELTKFYNLPYLVHIKENITSTGGIEANGNVIPIAGNHIQNKVEIIFYSPVEYFILPKADEPKARAKLLTLKENYPNRNLNLIPVENIDELLDRRSLIEIKKHPIVYRTAKFLKQNWIASILLLILTLILIFIFVKDWDDNPHSLDFKGKDVIVKNKLGKILWSLPTLYDEEANKNSNANDELYKVIDINGDGVNEVIVSYEAEEITQSENGRIACYDKNKTLKWKFLLDEHVATKMKSFSPDYRLQMLDTTTRNGTKELYLNASHASSEFPAAICRINIKTGQQLPGVLHEGGRFNTGLVIENSINKKKFLIVSLFKNGYERMGLLKIDLAKLVGQTPSDEVHTYKNKSFAELIEYLLVPNTDYNQYITHDHSNPISKTVRNDLARKKIILTVLEGKDSSNTTIAYEFTYDFNKVDIVTSSDFERARDSLVVYGKLSPPKSYTPEYQAKVKSGIMRWNGKVFEYPYKKSR